MPRVHVTSLAAPVLLAILPILPGCGPDGSHLLASRAASGSHSTERVEYFARDGLGIIASVYRPSGESPPGLILVHESGRERSHWKFFAKRAQREGYLCVVPDTRGHGESRMRGGAAIDHRSFSRGDWRRAVGDIASAKEALLEAGASKDNLFIVGAAFGANAGLAYALGDPEIVGVIMVSPGSTYHGIDAESAIRGFEGRPVLLLAGDRDLYSAESAWKLSELAPGFSEIHVYSASAHGTDLLWDAESATDQIFQWLEAIVVSVDP